MRAVRHSQLTSNWLDLPVVLPVPAMHHRHPNAHTAVSTCVSTHTSHPRTPLKPPTMQGLVARGAPSLAQQELCTNTAWALSERENDSRTFLGGTGSPSALPHAPPSPQLRCLQRGGKVEGQLSAQPLRAALPIGAIFSSSLQCP